MPLGALYKTSVTAETPAEQSFRMTNFLSLWTNSFSYLSWILFADLHSLRYLHWCKWKESQSLSFLHWEKVLEWVALKVPWLHTAQPPPLQSAIPTKQSTRLWTNRSTWSLQKARASSPLLMPLSFERPMFYSKTDCRFLFNTYELWNKSWFHLSHLALVLDRQIDSMDFTLRRFSGQILR